MRRLRLLRPAAAAGFLVGAAVAAAPQDAAVTLPLAYLVADATNTAYTDREEALALRPNAELAYSVYVVNPREDPVKGVEVVVARDKEGKQPLAKGTLPGLKGRESARVRLTAVGAAPPPATGKAGDPPPPAGAALTATSLYLVTTTTTDDGPKTPAGVEVPVQLLKPSRYIDPVVQPTFLPVDGGYELTVTLTDRVARENNKAKAFRGPPAKAVLDIRPALLNVDPAAPKSGTYETLVPPGGGTVALTATKLKLTGGRPEGKFAVSVDGYDRAFVFNIGSEGGNNATPLTKSFARLDLPKFAVPGKPLPVRVEVFHEPTDGKPVLTFQRSTAGDPQQLLANATTLRDEVRTLRVGGDGELVAASVLKDWVVPVDTAGVFGPRTFTLAAPGAEPATAVVTFDNTPPTLALADVPVSKFVGSKLQVFADAADAESGLKEVVFYLGEPPAADGKLPPTTEKADGVAFLPAKGQKAVPGRYTASFLLPDLKGKVKVYARAANGAELVTLTEGATVLVVDPPVPKSAKEKDKRQVGDIKVKVVQGSTPERPQPGLPVELRTAAGATVDSATTNDKGEAEFKDVQPGSYVVYSVKKADYGAKAFATVTVKADKKSEVTLEIKR